MPRTALDNFNDTLDRVLNLIALYDSLNPTRGRPAEEQADILRGAVVLCAAALDELILALIVEAIPTAAQRGLLGHTVEGWIRNDPVAFAGLLGAADQQSALRDLARGKLGRQTFQRASAIAELLGESIGADPPWAEAARELVRVGGPSTEEAVRDALDRFIDRRNRIAHDGDRRPGSSSLSSISKAYVSDGAKLVLEVGLAAQ